MKDGVVCRVFPTRMVTISFLLRHEYSTNQECLMSWCWPFALGFGRSTDLTVKWVSGASPSKSNNIKTGTGVGETIILEYIIVDAVEYCTKVVAKGGVFEKMREVMLWSHTAARYKTVAGVRVPCGKIVIGMWRFSNNEGTKCPEAGTRLLYQHDGARPHTARVNTQVFASHGKMKGFSIEFVVQPAPSPDLNVNNLALFTSLPLVAKGNRRDLQDAIIKCWHE